MSVQIVPGVSTSRPSVLIVDGDRGTCAILSKSFVIDGFDAVTAGCGAEAISALSASRFDVAIIDVRLPDDDGLTILRFLARNAVTTGVIVVSGFLTRAITMEAVRLGAFAVLDKPVDAVDLQRLVAQYVRQRRNHGRAVDRHAHGGFSEPRSTTERWSEMILRASEADTDLKTIGTVAVVAAVSVSTFSEMCRLVDVKPRAARDFARMLRASRLSHEERCHPKVFLDVSDRRTLQTLLHRAGMLDNDSDVVHPAEFVIGQHFISQSNSALIILRLLLSMRRSREPGASRMSS